MDGRNGAAGSATTLLHHVGQLMGKHLPGGGGCGGWLARPDDHVLPHRVGPCAHRLGRLCRLRIGVHPDLAEVPAKARLHVAAGGRIEGVAGGGHHLADDWGQGGRARMLLSNVAGLVALTP